MLYILHRKFIVQLFLGNPPPCLEIPPPPPPPTGGMIFLEIYAHLSFFFILTEYYNYF